MKASKAASEMGTGVVIWKTFDILEGAVCQWESGPLKIWVKRVKNDWLLANRIVEDAESSESWSVIDSEPPDLDWTRWSFGEENGRIQFSPVMTDRALVVKTRIPSNLPVDEITKFYISLPVCVKLSCVKKEQVIELVRIQSSTLSNTWFGDNFEGELCYSIKTSAVRDLHEIPRRLNRAICQVTINNKSDSPLPIQKICIRPKHLNIYSSNGQFWTSKVDVTFRGVDLISRVDYRDEVPTGDQNPELLLEAEEEPDNKFLSTISTNLRNFF